MTNAAMILGGLILVASIFGYLYADDKQGEVEVGDADEEDDVEMDWNFVQSISAAGIIGGLLLIIGGILAAGRNYEHDEETV